MTSDTQRLVILGIAVGKVYFDIRVAFGEPSHAGFYRADVANRSIDPSLESTTHVWSCVTLAVIAIVAVATLFVIALRSQADAPTVWGLAVWGVTVPIVIWLTISRRPKPGSQ